MTHQPFTLSREEASAVMALDMNVKITPHMQKLLDSVEQRGKEAGLTGQNVVARAH